ncbi:MAG TPA: trypsin-like peptidase domain-containing protein, partial [Chitinophagales bacterium]|nr:trypsin-like peptidase domain-containing protein [Chitinophagales bacterium]
DICIEYYEPKAQKGKGLFNIDFLLYRLNDFPYGTTHRLKKTVPIASPYSKWRNDHISETIEKMPLKQLGSVAEQPTNYTLDNSGVWETLPNGDRVWRLGIRCELGYAISLWTKIVIPKGGYFTYYSPDGYYVSSLYTAPSNSYNNDLFTADMPGKELIVEYYEPKNAKGKGSVQVLRVELNITKWHTAALERGDREEQDLGEPTCSPNVVCDCDEFIDTVTTTPTFCSTSLLDLPETLKKSVVRIRRYFPCAASTPDSLCLQEPGGTGVEVYEPGGLPPFCTGTLLNNADCKPYVLTASHCLRRGLNPELLIPYNSEQSQEVYFRFDFNFDSESCNIALSPTEQAQDRIQTGAKLHAISVRLNTTGIDASENATGIGDFMLLELKQSIPPEYNAMFAGWNAEQTLPDKGVSVSHPSGYDKRFALQDDSISQITITPEVYNGVRPFRNNNPNYIANISTTDSNNNNHGSYFGLTFDRGSVLGGSSGSGYFNPTGQLIGTLSGGPGECRTSAMPQFSHPNGNNNMLTHYGRFWYYYDHVPTEGTNWNTQTAKQIEASTSEGGATITAYEKRHTLKTWLGSTTNSMGAVEVQNCEIYLKDNTWDNSHNEPNQTALIDNSWYDIWESPDLWNTTVAFNTDIDPENYEALLGSDNEEPDFIDNTSDELLDNYIRYNVRTPYTNECTTQPASLHLYWTIASTGEMWPDHWINHYVDNNCLVGQEITIHSNGDPYPVAIDPLAENSTWEGYVHWSPPNFTDPTVDDYYPFTSVIDNCPSINADADNNDKVEICLLARLQSLDNPIFGIETANTAQNVLNSNNIVTRNTFLADPGIVGMAPDGGPSGNIISYGHPSIILIANNNDYVKNLDITLDKISEGSTEALEQLMYIDLIPGDELWQKWESTGFKGEGIQIIAEKVIRVTNLETAKLLDIPFDAKEFEPLKIKVTIISYTGKRPSVADLPDEYKFRVSHRASRPTEQGSINPPTDCLFTVKDIAKYGSTALPTEISLKVYPNPFKDQLNIVF